MTIKVTVTNSDPRDTAIIVVECVHPVGDNISTTRPLHSGESVELYVHSNQVLVVRELSQ